MKRIVVGSGIFVGVGFVVTAYAGVSGDDVSLIRDVGLTLIMLPLAFAAWVTYSLVGVSLLRTIRRWKDPEAKSGSGRSDG